MAIQNAINLTATGIIAADGAGVFSGRTITAGTGISMANGDGTGGNPTVSLIVPVTEVNGGTNQTTYAKGDILYASGVNTLSKLAAGSDGEVLTLAGGEPSWAVNAGGDVTGPASSTDNAIVRFDGGTGKIIQNSVSTLSDLGVFTSQNASAGSNLGHRFANTSNTAGSGLNFRFANGGASGGDPWLRWAIEGVREYSMGIDNDASDAFVLTNASTLNGTNFFSMSTAGDMSFEQGDVDVTRSDASYVQTTMSNTNNANAAADARVRLLVAGTGGGDPYVAYEISGGQAYSVGCRNADSDDAFDMWSSSVLGSGTQFFSYKPTTDNLVIPNQLLTMNSNSAGVDVRMRINNENTSASSNAMIEVYTAAGGTDQDAYIKCAKAATRSYCWGVDDSDSDKLKVNTQGSTNVTPSTGTNLWTMTSAGERTMPLQPAFLSYLNSGDANVTGDGTAYTLGGTTALTEAFDQGGDITTGGTFTSPVTGRYYLGSNFLMQGLTNGTNIVNSRINTSNATYNLNNDADTFTGNNQYEMVTFADMDAADTATITLLASGGGKTVDIYGGSDRRTSFWGWLVC